MRNLFSKHHTQMRAFAKRWMGMVLALGFSTTMLAQQDPQFTQYMFNLLALNGSASKVPRLRKRSPFTHRYGGRA